MKDGPRSYRFNAGVLKEHRVLKFNGLGRLAISLGPSGLSVGSLRIHYAWVIVTLAAAMWMISSSIRFSATVLIPHLQDPAGFGWSYGAIAFAFSIQWLLSGLLGPVMGWMGDRYGVRRTMVLGACLFIAGMLLAGSMSHLWQFYLSFGILIPNPPMDRDGWREDSGRG